MKFQNYFMYHYHFLEMNLKNITLIIILKLKKIFHCTWLKRVPIIIGEALDILYIFINITIILYGVLLLNYKQFHKKIKQKIKTNHSPVISIAGEIKFLQNETVVKKTVTSLSGKLYIIS